MVSRHLLCALLAIMLITARLRGDEPDLQLDGKWVVASLTINGTELPLSESPDSFWFDIDGKEWTYSFVVDGQRTTARFAVTLSEGDSTALVDAKLMNGAHAGGVCKGICRIDGDVLQLCLAETPATARPTQFECPENSELQLIKLRRAQSLESSR